AKDLQKNPRSRRGFCRCGRCRSRAFSGRRRHVTLRGVRAFAEEELLGLLLHPGLPGFLRNAFVDPLAEFARQRREIEAFGFLAELRALNHTSHTVLLLKSVWG